MDGLYGHKVVTLTVASAASVSDAAEVKGWNHVAFEIPSFACNLATTTANIFCQVAKERSDTFRRVKDMGVYSAVSGIEDWEVPSTVGNFFVVCRPAARFDYCKVELTGAATNGLAINVHVHN